MRIARGLRETALALAVAGLVALVFTWAADSAQLRSLETASLDLRFRLRGVRTPGPETVIVMIDDRSLAALGRWPFSRQVMAQAVAALDRAGARLIIFDLLFAEAEPSRPGEDADAAFAEAIRANGKVLLPVALSFSSTSPAGAPDVSAAAFQRFDRSPVEPDFPLRPNLALPPIEPLAAAARGLGHITLAYDRDGAPRYDYLALPYEGDFVPSLPLRAAAEFRGLDWAQVGLALGQGVQLGDQLVPTDVAMRLLINYRGPRGTFPTYSFVDLVQGRVPDAALEGRVVLIGASFLGNSDSNPAPFAQAPLPGTERLANILDMLLRRDFLSAEPAAWSLAVLASVLLAGLAGAAAAAMPTRAMAAAGLLPIGAWAAAAQLAFLRGLWLPLVQPVATLAAATGAVLLYRYWLVDRDGRRIRLAFQHYMAPAQVELLAAHPERLRLGGDTRTMTMLFCDIRGFTAISEQFKSDPQGLTRLINRFLTPMTDAIMARRGTIDKYMGDCIMAFWNAPLDDPAHADHACESALAMLAELDALNARLAEEAARAGRPVRHLAIGIGLNSGEVVVGNMGSDRRFDYSVLGDAVNLASRLEGQSKTYGVSVVIGEATRALAPGWATLELDLIAVKGKQEAVRIHALLGDAAVARSAAHAALTARHQHMLDRYRAQDWVGARAALAVCRGVDKRFGQLYDLYEDRIAHYLASPPGPDWDGVFVATSK